MLTAEMSDAAGHYSEIHSCRATLGGVLNAFERMLTHSFLGLDPHMGVSENWHTLVWGPYNKDPII